MNSEWIEISIVTTSEAVEPIQGVIYTTDVKGVSVIDSEDLEFKKKHPGDWDYFDENILNIRKGAVIKAYYNSSVDHKEVEEYIRKGIQQVKEYGVNIEPGTIMVNTVNEEDWANNWKKYYKSTKVGARVVIKPQWEEYTPKAHELVVELDPGMAFGTGTHETTRMCIQALERYVDEGKTVFDIGTGSGILAIAAAKLGSKSVIGGDLDPVAVDSANMNIGLNNLGNNIRIFHGDLMQGVAGRADVVVANIIADVIMFLTPQLRDYIVDGGYFISSGIIKDRKDEVVKTLIKNGFEPMEVNNQGEWICIVAKKHEDFPR
ncbi:50S ribosomal protein L11 methyltransferase [Clostridium cellulovorans]|uniref:Ribosomal protein L11 methyltransferase n=1 Tax=Clostridium cellulovorans (strain ATCC 35296 / DSM 3052 / OCM 3 / 743B) TaxID=573061 RepID=D9SW27_CLOC7|nr:50S ribosomal protein L11 methyltransferase [Clostridium cellulovorans]ADL51171.1 ribosomal protein L11 methyltransferase [Clostridium cellulovorans 743B]